QLRLRRVGIGESEGRELARDGPRLEVVEALHPRDARLDLRAGFIAPVRRCDRGLAADELLQRPVGDRVSVRQTGSARDRLRRVEAPQEFEGDARLAHARVSIDGYEMRPTR